MNILILGSHGFIGSYLVEAFLSKGDLVTGCDLVEDAASGFDYHKISILSPDFDSLFSTSKFDCCINASGSGNVSFSFENPISDFEANTLCVAKVLDTIRKYEPSCRYIHLSSAAVYGNPQSLPVKETDATAPLSPYGFHKLMSEQLCSEYYTLYKLPITIVRPFSVYGNGLKKQLLWDICTKLSKNKSIVLFGTGNETRDFLHVSDMASFITRIVEKSDFTAATYNLASGEETSIRDIASIFEQHFPGNKTISFSGEEKKGDPINWRADVSAIAKMGLQPKKLLKDSIVDYINWYSALPHAW